MDLSAGGERFTLLSKVKSYGNEEEKKKNGHNLGLAGMLQKRNGGMKN